MNAHRTLPTNRAPTPDRAPGLVRAPDGLVQWLLRHGAPLGPNGLLTIRGRTTGTPRTAPIAITEVDGRRYVIGAYGDVNWTRNLRAAGEADVALHGRTEHVRATELDPTAAEEFFGVTLHRYIDDFPWFGRVFARLLFGLVGPEVLDDPATAAATRPVFELTTASSRYGSSPPSTCALRPGERRPVDLRGLAADHEQVQRTASGPCAGAEAQPLRSAAPRRDPVRR